MTWDEISGCMKWVKVTLREECPVLKVTVDLTLQKKFG